ncbi:MAG: hypothetical protein MIO92_02100 [Methanosarcinaceae archaeon]|nr:hypothetical protein [Methanosarcinaceae archaeon]
MKRTKLLEERIKHELKPLFESFGSTRYFVEVRAKGHEFGAHIWLEKELFDPIASDKEKLKMISDAIRHLEMEFNTTIFEELKPLL